VEEGWEPSSRCFAASASDVIVETFGFSAVISSEVVSPAQQASRMGGQRMMAGGCE
jgi:hypothetical protein